MKRVDDFRERRANPLGFGRFRGRSVAELSDAELKEAFWDLARLVVAPLVDLAASHTSPSIERSVLLRMGFSSLEAAAIVNKCSEEGLLGKGAGNLVWRLARAQGVGVREAGLDLSEGRFWAEARKLAGFEAPPSVGEPVSDPGLRPDGPEHPGGEA